MISHQIHYFIPIYRELSKIKDISFTVIYYSKEHHIRDEWNSFEGYHWINLSKSNRKFPKFFLNAIRIDILKYIWKEKYDIIWIHGYYATTNWVAIILQSINKRVSLLRTEDV
ncbi:hypothetical protein A7K93_11340 [Candidatus Methylacidiphilum fumarolicum]|uniref:Glycosyltransferase subfamily 4-like N-terminal domain-containing protein n=2 Tax=Candidatus Methylacidiphilum fumarolicum TaxID=591154 RepID=I0JYC0_METFB|nr:hypothetical protein [Candidatus Methylacidiphilum fumarolicum]MBW6416035.1 hypothetical protein [Candidatus Methylacidiphilum fumarolicum]TFE70799.1 hypothetical protein A7K73_03165 [Candidatus Methylacidiphilum fumarolicum]TFE71169.1 hypothetical protein A7K93_11340 [Candidatus Methylacidiphilum fumarolicum]TFE72973.1 hypothetical protein A7K72_07495 [Candidatus Methylacidiphilum fumarolicum]TFE77114.1 hypothetical protein A7D33_00440 [Candidatus Methylacidiphilum fumarolicum]